MKIDQKYTPKYWVVHDKGTDDVFLWTGSKSFQGAIDEYNLNMEVPFEDSPTLEVVLVSLEMVDL
jgi:hypothetical protein